ncbi:MAG: sigma-54 dependent transcriptional regulator [Acidobacteriaceae bacterium]
MARVLIVEDEPHMRKLIGMHLRNEGHTVVAVATLKEGLATLDTQDFDAIVTDQRLPDGEGIDILKALTQSESATAVVVLTAYGSVELAVETMRKGAFDFLTKPFLTDNLKAVVQRAAQHTVLRRENALLRTAMGSLEGHSEIQGHSPKMERLRELIGRVGPTEATVLITGETGTGKELVARALHKASARAAKPLISVNCAAFSETLLESELFGHEKGSFTGADRVRYGLFETAHQGTLFLDEAGEMSAAAQAKLLRVLAEGKITRVGSTVSREVDVRVLVATHRDLLKEVAKGTFRQDLYYRLAIVPIEVPALRERAEDIPALSKYLLREIASELKVGQRALAPGVLQRLQAYRFPGNVRELRNLLERACILSNDPEIEWIDLPIEPEQSGLDITPAFPDAFHLRTVMASWERSAIEQMLVKTGGAKAEAARRLGISKSDLTYKLAKLAAAKMQQNQGADSGPTVPPFTRDVPNAK